MGKACLVLLILFVLVIDCRAETDTYRFSWAVNDDLMSNMYGIQAVGRGSYEGTYDFYQGDFYMAPAPYPAHSNADFLSYGVQVEEDIINREILNIVSESATDPLKAEVEDVILFGNIRDRDDYFRDEADAQGGRVTRDRLGNWIRVQQYVLRTGVNEVDLLGVVMRSDTAGDLSGLSTYIMRVMFSTVYEGDLRNLPWSLWLDTWSMDMVDYTDSDFFEDDDCDGTDLAAFAAAFGSHVESQNYDPDADFAADEDVDLSDLALMSSCLGNTACLSSSVRFINTTPDAPELHEMVVEFTNAQDESLRESRRFGPKEGGDLQNIIGEQLTVSTLSHQYGIYDYDESPSGKEYAVVVGTAGEFRYDLDDCSDENIVTLYEADDEGDVAADNSDEVYHDIWDALRVNETEGPYIGNSVLEIAVDKEGHFYDIPIDVVIIPMSRMIWKN